MKNVRDLSPKVALASAGLFVIIGLGVYRIHVTQAYSEPPDATDRLLVAASTGDLAGFKQSATPEYCAQFVRHFGQAKYHRASLAYQRLYQLGLQRWYEYRQRADYQANLAYDALQERVRDLGREAFNNLSIERRLEMINDPAQHAVFVLEQGLKALPPDERRRISDVNAFREYSDRADFIRRERWTYTSEADRKELVSPAALVDEFSPEKTAFCDRAGLPRLEKPWKSEIEGIARRELDEPETFKLKHGVPLAKAYLAGAKIPRPSARPRCVFPAQDVNGSVLRGAVANCSLPLPTEQRKSQTNVGLVLQKHEFRWLVAGVQPELYQITW